MLTYKDGQTWTPIASNLRDYLLGLQYLPIGNGELYVLGLNMNTNAMGLFHSQNAEQWNKIELPTYFSQSQLFYVQ